MSFTETNFLEFTGLLTLKIGIVDSQMSSSPKYTEPWRRASTALLPFQSLCASTDLRLNQTWFLVLVLNQRGCQVLLNSTNEVNVD